MGAESLMLGVPFWFDYLQKDFEETISTKISLPFHLIWVLL
jgi:hypothetical protein